MLTSCFNKAPTYTLYRNSVVVEHARIRIATFDANVKDENYNQVNCNDSAKLRLNQDGVRTKFWCEKGKFRD